jgi:hypothetical protein
LRSRAKQRVEPKRGAERLGEDPSRVGWMGVTIHAPEGWSPVSISSEGENGYLKVVSPDTRFLEVKWERPKGAPSVPKALDGYFEKLRKAAKKARREIDLKTRPKGLTAIRPQSQGPIPYTWLADRRAFGCIWHCGTCNKMVIAEVVGEPDDDLSFAGDLLRAIEDHGEEGWNEWSLYGLTVPAPAAYRMEKQVLMTGHQRFELRAGTASILADRWGLAEIALRGATVRQWYESRESGTLMRYAYRVEEVDLHGHPALRFTGRDRIPFGLLKVLRASSRLRWPTFFLKGYVWHCAESNRIYALFGEQTRKSTVIDEVAAKMCCHGD